MARWRHIALVWMALCLVPSLGHAEASQLSKSYLVFTRSSNHWEAQIFRCVTTGAGDDPVTGEACETGDWSQPIDARWANHMTVYAYEFGTALDLKVWDCIDPTVVGALGTVAKPGIEDPSGTPTVADPDPLCVDLTAGAGITIDGDAAGIQKFTLSERKFNHLVLEINLCTACDNVIHMTLTHSKGHR